MGKPKSSRMGRAITVFNVLVAYSHLLAAAGVMEYAGHKTNEEAVHALKSCFGLAAFTFVLGFVAVVKDITIANAARVFAMIYVVAVGILWSQTSLLELTRAYAEVDANLIGLSSLLIVLGSAAALGLMYNVGPRKPKQSKD